LLAATGAEASDAPWTAAGFARSALRIAGDSAWAAGDGTLRSPPIPVPAEADTVSVLFWTRYEGDGFDLAPHGEVRISTDGGATWALAGLVAGVALEYYPERVDVRGVAGRSLLIEFVARFGAPAPLWWLDEVTVVAHVPAAATDVASLPEASFRPAENPVRGGVARLAWPFGGLGGEMLIYDIAGRLVWRERVLGNAGQVAWNVSDSGAANGVYIVVLRAAGRTVRGKLFVARGAS
ncbi:MAG: T9SS type A sorting domain-containing protein, partial [Gemmatimonadaceae bacterium]